MPPHLYFFPPTDSTQVYTYLISYTITFLLPFTVLLIKFIVPTELTLEAKTKALQIKCLRCILQGTYWGMSVF